MSFKVRDHYFKKAKKDNYLARSVYKLEEINKKHKVIKKGDFVLDLGYFPGSWTQFTCKAIGPGGKVVGVDIQPINNKTQMPPQAHLFEGDIFQLETIWSEILESIGKKGEDNFLFDHVISDMAPKTTGIKMVDSARSLELVEKVFETLPTLLKPGGNFVIKVFEGQDAQSFLKEAGKIFKKTARLKPDSTRSVSKEFFFIGLGLKG